MPHLTVIAYLDPGTGSLIVQMIVAAFLGAGFMMRKYLFAPVGWLLRKRNRQNTSSDTSTDSKP